MTRYLKVLGLTAVAALAMTAVMASAAQAAPAFTSESTSTTFTGDQAESHVFTAAGGTVTCANADFHGTQTGTSAADATMTPKYSECTAFGFVEATVDVNGCTYTLYPAGGVDLVCPAGKEITITAFTCTIHIPPQTGLGTISYATGVKNNKHDLTATINISGITGTATSGFLCPATNGHFSNGTLKGKSTVTAIDVNTGLPTGITHDPS